MNSAAIAVLTCLLVLSAQAQLGARVRRCMCASKIDRIHPKLIKDLVIHEPSNSCPHTEIIITTTTDKEKCLNPYSKVGKLILENKKKQEERVAQSMTTSSGQTATSRHHTTSKL